MTRIKQQQLSLALCMLLMVFTGCGTKKKAVSDTTPVPEPAAPAWHTCLIQGSRATVITDEDRISATLTMQTVRDSMIVISVMPMLGIEMARIEATPMEITAIDKMHGRFARSTYADLNRKATPAVNWDILQQLCSAELPTGAEKARLMYAFGDETIEIVIDYGQRQLDVPVRINALPTNRYTQIDISKWL